MKLSEFVSEVTRRESKKKQVAVGDVREVLRIVNEMLQGELYKAIRGARKDNFQE